MIRNLTQNSFQKISVIFCLLRTRRFKYERLKIVRFFYNRFTLQYNSTLQ